MKANKPRVYLYTAGACLVLAAALLLYYFASGLLRGDSVQYIYIDGDDTQDSVFAKVSPMARRHSFSGFCTLARHTS